MDNMTEKQIDFVDVFDEVAELKKSIEKQKEINKDYVDEVYRLQTRVGKAVKDIEFLGLQVTALLLRADVAKETETTILEHLNEIYDKWEIIK